MADPLIELLDRSTVAKRLAPDLPAWEAQRPFWGRDRRAEFDRLQPTVLAHLAAAYRPCFVYEHESLEPGDLGPGAWERVAPHTWAIPGDFDPTRFKSSYLYLVGGYDVYASAEPVLESWWVSGAWDKRAAPAEELALLKRRGIRALLSTGPDNDWWSLWLPAERASA